MTDCKGNLYKLQDAVNSSHSLVEKKIAVRKWLDNIGESLLCDDAMS